MEGQREGWERAGTQDEMQRLHKTLTCIHAVVHLVVTGLSIFTQVAWGWGFWELEGRWFITWPPVWLLSRPLQNHSFRPLRRGRELKAGSLFTFSLLTLSTTLCFVPSLFQADTPPFL